MDDQLIKGLENLGAFGIIVLTIWRFPSIVTAYSNGVQLIITNVTGIQDKALQAFKEEMSKDREVLTEKLSNLETGMTKAIELATTVLNNQDKMNIRLEAVEKAVNK